MEAMVLNNHSYIKKSTIPELATELMRRKEYIRSQTIKMKINEPPKKLLPLKNYILPETVYRNNNFYVSVVCKVYFGGEFSTTHPFAWLPV